MIKNRFDFIYIFDVKDGNPNGDPGADNMPRIDDETGEGLVTDVCLKRKVRNYVLVKKELAEGFDIYIKERAILDSIINKVYENDNVKQAKKEDKRAASQKLLCAKFFDIRTFGAAITTSGKQDQVRGPIQFTFARSASPIQAKLNMITRMAATKEARNDNEEQKDNERQKERTIGNKYIVPYGLYVCHGFISANLAKQTGFSEDDLALFWEALKNMFDVDRSAARGLMSAQKLIVFKHDSVLGNAPANKLFERVKVEKVSDGAPRQFADYQVSIDKENLPAGVTIEELI